ncbi:MAG TPA: TonB-dependent receptor, partial [Flavobacteriaceae bacterium]|nr:TonB-dependent receptor [Flavobacteriaceae bacterium]
FELSGRLSRLKSIGYIDRSGSKLRSYFIQGIYKDENTLVKLLNFAGHEITDQAWFGVDNQTLKTNRKYNFAGEYYDDKGNIMYYENQDDNYKQDHYQLHWNQVFENNLVSNLGLHYTYGRGYFENYNIGYDDGISKSPDFIDRRWLDNDFYGLIFSLNKTTDKYNVSIGGSYNIYDGEHYGEYLWYGQNNDLNNNKEYKERFYDDYGNKKEFNIYTKIDFPLSSRLSLYGDLQYRKIYYKADITPYSVITGYVEEGYNSIDKVFNFFNPKFGFILKHHDNSNFYLSYSRAQREPTRTDYANGSPNPEKLDDFEFGWKGQFKKISFNLNSFYMLYDDQLVLTGQRDNNGYEIRRNIGESYRLGLELETRLFINSKWDLETNLTISENKNKDFYYKFDGELKSFGNTNLAYSPSIIANNIINFNPNEKVLISLRSNYISEQYFAQINTPISRLDSFLINDLSFIHDISIPNVSNDIKFKVLINNLFDIKYSSYGGHYTYDLMENSQTKTYEGTYYYPQAGINILVALDIKI